ncbi:lysozyme inhibitor LprI family protein [Vibrio europaeus]|uniref:lysozyme inhibitor LprI family protein n=1 Tax=Vibrio europaeus TaxID=300876 RepID=UPI00233E5EEC|nr:lysozyme inhibitor LprI family protein [Vibrio europaeus]MDC5856750.1 lysozyme inhibitor LprI family protein [Vibrio europaeus]
MMTKFIPIVLGCSLAFSASATELDLVTKAQQLYEAGDKKQAQILFTQAADQGNAEAHFRLAYQYILPDEESVYHLQKAAVLGHQEALEYYLDKVFFRAGSIRMSDPKSALETYNKAKQKNPSLSLYDEQEKVQVLTYAAEVPERDPDAFFKTYLVEDEDGDWPFYDVWELAEQASKEGSKFGKPDPELVFWLITRGGDVPAELSFAVTDYYKHWKNDQVVPFNLCHYVTSGVGAGYCADRDAVEQEKRRQSELSALTKKLSGESLALLNLAYKEMEDFVTLKAQQEEMHGGSGRTAWIIGSIQEQKDLYLSMLDKAIQGDIETVSTPLSETDSQLNTTYKKLMSALKLPSEDYAMPKPEADDVREVQRQWIKHRDATCRLIASVEPRLKEQCLNWITAQREQELQGIITP